MSQVFPSKVCVFGFVGLCMVLVVREEVFYEASCVYSG